MEPDSDLKAFMEDISQRYSVVNVRLNQHDALLHKIDLMEKKWEDLHSLVEAHLHESKKQISEMQKEIGRLYTTLDYLKKTVDDLSVQVVSFEKNLKEHKEHSSSTEVALYDLFNKLNDKVIAFDGKYVDMHSLHQHMEMNKLSEEGMNKNLLQFKDTLKLLQGQISSLHESLSTHRSMYESLKKESLAEKMCMTQEIENLKSKSKSLEIGISSRENSLKESMDKKISDAKKEMVLSPESYESLQKEMHKKMDILSLDAQNSVLRASVCDQQLKIMQRHIEAINQKIRLLELEK